MNTRKPLFCFVFIIICHSIIAQKSMRDSNKIWKLSEYVWTYEYASIYTITKNDTLTLNGKTYFNYDDNWVREDSQKVYFLSQNQEYLLYDFLLNEGDSIYSYSTNSLKPYLFKITKKKKIKFKNGIDSLTYQELKCLNNPKIYKEIIVIEGIGAINTHPVKAYRMFELTDLMNEVTCFLYKNQKVLEELIGFKQCCYTENILDTNNQWTIYESDDNGDTKRTSFISPSKKDSLISGLNYRVFKKNNLEPIYIRKEAKNYYQWDELNSSFLIYKEDAKIGDTIQNRPGSQPLIVDSIHLKLIHNNLFKIYYVQNDSILSGLGNTNQIFLQKNRKFTPEYRSGNICFKNSNCSVLFSEYPESKFFKNCSTDIGIKNYNHIFKIYPTITFDFINIESGISKPTLIQIYNTFGHLVYSNYIQDKLQQISLKKLSSGFYFIEIEDTKTKILKY
jgi:hypothetical protein